MFVCFTDTVYDIFAFFFLGGGGSSHSFAVLTTSAESNDPS